MRPLSKALTDLIACAEDIIVRPAILGPRPSDAFTHLAAEIRAADHRPAESVRTTRAAMVMILSIENFFAESRGDYYWQIIISATLPKLRSDAFQALQNERETLAAPEQAEPYARSRTAPLERTCR